MFAMPDTKHLLHWRMVWYWLSQANLYFGLPLSNKEIVMQQLLDVIKVRATRDYKLFMEFENGEKRVFDIAPETLYDRSILE